jgi:EAL domain-containing protein (putative c-di-GMP-specific phosphodiesterase class I)
MLPPMRVSLDRILPVLPLAALAVYLFALDPAARDVVHAVFPVLAAAAIVVGVERHRPAQRRAWLWLALGMFAFGVGHVLALLPPLVPGLTPGTVAVLAGYAAVLVGAFLFSRSTGLSDRVALLDAAIIGLALTLIVWHVFLEPATGGTSSHGPVMTVLLLVYPVADIVVVAVLLPLLIADPARRLATGALVATFAIFALGDGLAAADLIVGTRTWLADAELMTVLGSALVAIVAASRSLIDVGAERRPPSPDRDLLRTIGVSSAVLVPPVVLLLSAGDGNDTNRHLETVASVVIAALVVLRLQRTVRSLVQIETRFNQFMAHPGLMAIIKDDQGRYRYMNAQAIAANHLDGSRWYQRRDGDLFEPEVSAHRRSVDAAVRETHATQVGTYGVGGRQWHTEKFELRDRPGWVGMLAVDVTDRIRAEERQREVEAILAATYRAVARTSEQRTAERAVVRQALRAIHGEASPEHLAAIVCQAMAAVPEFVVGAVVAFDDEAASVLAFLGADGRPPKLLPLTAERSSYLHDRAARGPWVERWFGDDTHPYADVIRAADVAAHAYAPVVADGRLLGLLVAGSAEPDAMLKLTEWLPALTEFAEITGALMDPGMAERSTRDKRIAAIRSVIDGQRFESVFQPIVDLRSGAALGFEALTRFDDGTPPDVRFEEAHLVGLGVELELAAIRTALIAAERLPAGAWLNVNVSPPTVRAAGLRELLEGVARDLVVEITEHDEVTDYAEFRAAFAALDGRARLCIDDAGAGFSSLRHVVELGPAFVKLDRSLVAGVDRDPARQAAIAGLVHYAGVAGVRLVAEGIEEQGELDVLRSLGIVLGQGYLLGRPAPVATFARMPRGQAMRPRVPHARRPIEARGPAGGGIAAPLRVAVD